MMTRFFAPRVRAEHRTLFRVWLMQKAKMSRKTEVVHTYHQKTGTKSSVVANVSVKESDNAETETKIYDHQCRTLFVRFPRRVRDKLEVKLLHPGIEDVRFKPRIKRWCHIRFSSEEAAKCALNDLNRKRVRGGQLIVMETKKFKINSREEKSKKQQHLYKLYVKNLPEDVTESEITSAFPGCANVRMFTPKKRGSLRARIGFKTLDEMEAIISSTNVHKVRDRSVSVFYSKSYLHAHDLLKQEQKTNNLIRISKDVSPKSILTSNSLTKIKVSSARKQKTIVTSKRLGEMIETTLSQLKTEDNGDDIEEDDRCKQGIEMDTQDNTEFNDDISDNSDDFSQHKEIELDDNFSQYKAIKLEGEVIDGSGDSDDFSKYKAIQLEDEVISNNKDGGDDDNGDFSHYKAIELEDEVTRSSDDDFSKYKAIELEDEGTETSYDDGDDGGRNCVDD
ncbi:uncharacterized protein LOC110837554 isoform X2 [Zootermopsis nevadensis]|uniref:uncharacterized protein LOC110837554 isoform X2 n=1 Tax=Zootermopsis nevadensis TaxID=136037 RepID=UPI000B8E4227|nr:uncharacterized protein LOC110837554 isoform X2 [Zootermopsis nevadensis]